MILSETIKAFRAEKCRTQEDLSKISSASLPSIKRHETGNNVAATINLKITDIFEVDLSNFMSLKNGKIVSKSVFQSRNFSSNIFTNPYNLKKSQLDQIQEYLIYIRQISANVGAGKSVEINDIEIYDTDILAPFF